MKRILSWLPVVIWFGFISLLSSIPGKTITSIALSSDFLLFWGHRIAHLGEYGVLGCLVIRAYSKETIKVTVVTIIILAMFIFLCGAFDEWHQSFVPGRTPDLLDALFDTVCGTFGMLMYKLFVLNKRYGTLLK